MTHRVQYTTAGEGTELIAPEAVLTVKIDAAHFTVISPTAKFLAVSLTGAKGSHEVIVAGVEAVR
jgi:hypothetical protein